MELENTCASIYVYLWVFDIQYVYIDVYTFSCVSNLCISIFKNTNSHSSSTLVSPQDSLKPSLFLHLLFDNDNSGYPYPQIYAFLDPLTYAQSSKFTGCLLGLTSTCWPPTTTSPT